MAIPPTDDLTQALQFHPYANLFPLIEGAEFDELVAPDDWPELSACLRRAAP